MKITFKRNNVTDSECILSITFLFVLFFFCFTPSYETNDDALMNFIASGSLTGIPSAAFLFSNYLYGYFVSKLYVLSDNINWYPIIFIIVQYFSWLSFGFSLLKKTKSRIVFVCFLLVLIIFGYYFLLKLQFTSTAFLAECAGAVLFFQYLKNNENQSKLFYVAYFFLLIGALIRWDCFIACCILACPFLFYLLKDNHFKVRMHPRYIFLLLLFLLPVINSFAYHSFYQSDYPAYQKNAHRLLDYPVSLNEHDLKTVSWSENDLAVFRNYFRADEIFSKENLEILNKEAVLQADFVQAIIILFHYSTSSAFFTCLFFILCMLHLTSTKIELTKALLHLLFLFLLLMMLPVFFKLPLRVFIPMLFMTLVFHVWYFPFRKSRESKQNFALKISGFVVLILASLQISILRNISRVQAENMDETIQINNFIQSHPETLFIAVDCPLAYMQIPLFETAPEYAGHQFFPVATFTHSPVYEQLLSMHQIKNLSSEIVSKQVVVINTEESFFRHYTLFMKEHYDLDISFEDYNEIPFAKKLILNTF